MTGINLGNVLGDFVGNNVGKVARKVVGDNAGTSVHQLSPNFSKLGEPAQHAIMDVAQWGNIPMISPNATSIPKDLKYFNT